MHLFLSSGFPVLRCSMCLLAGKELEVVQDIAEHRTGWLMHFFPPPLCLFLGLLLYLLFLHFEAGSLWLDSNALKFIVLDLTDFTSWSNTPVSVFPVMAFLVSFNSLALWFACFSFVVSRIKLWILCMLSGSSPHDLSAVPSSFLLELLVFIPNCYLDYVF